MHFEVVTHSCKPQLYITVGRSYESIGTLYKQHGDRFYQYTTLTTFTINSITVKGLEGVMKSIGRLMDFIYVPQLLLYY